MKLYVISWFGRRIYPELIERRKKIHKTQIDWALAQGLEPVVYAQEYAPEDYLEGVTYIKSETPNHPSIGRNILLKHFYQTSDDWAVFADNDAILYDDDTHADSHHFIAEFKKIDPKDIKYVAAITPIDGRQTPFRATLETNGWQKNWILKRKNNLKGSLFVMKNMKKAFNEEIYFDETFGADGKFIPYEDLDFAITITKKNYGVYEMQNIILKEIGSNISTWAKNDRITQFNEGAEDRNSGSEIGRLKILEKWGRLDLKDHGRKWSELCSNNTREKSLNISKDGDDSNQFFTIN